MQISFNFLRFKRDTNAHSRCVEGSHPSTRWARSIEMGKVKEEENAEGDEGGGGEELDEHGELLWLESDRGQGSNVLSKQKGLGDHLNVTDTVGRRHQSRRDGLKGRRR